MNTHAVIKFQSKKKTDFSFSDLIAISFLKNYVTEQKFKMTKPRTPQKEHHQTIFFYTPCDSSNCAKATCTKANFLQFSLAR